MSELAQQIRDMVRTNVTKLDELREAAVAECNAPGKWSRKEILGHLIDSALNNHQRFVRAMLQECVELPGYDQNGWVTVNDYQNEPWSEIVGMWTQVNLRLARIVDKIPQQKWATQCVIGGGAAVTLKFLVEDYIRHMRHHLGQIL